MSNKTAWSTVYKEFIEEQSKNVYCVLWGYFKNKALQNNPKNIQSH